MPLNKTRFFQNLLALSAVTLIIIIYSTVSYLIYQNNLLKSEIGKKDKPNLLPYNPSPTPSFTCPENGWIDCMPGPDKPPRYGGCSQDASEDAIKWYKINCSNYQGIAY